MSYQKFQPPKTGTEIEAFLRVCFDRVEQAIRPDVNRRNVQLRHVLTNALGTFAGVSCACLSFLLLADIAVANDFAELPEELEVELALSALPEELQAHATIYVRDPKTGFVVHRQGSNGWVTFVARTSVRFHEADWEYEYPIDQIIPMAYDKVGQAHHLVPYFDIERMRIDGVSAPEAKRVIHSRFAEGTYSAPSKGGMSYMLAPIHRAYMEPAISSYLGTVSFPHHMPYAPHVNAASFGAMDPHGHSGVLDHGGPDSGAHGYMYFLVQPDQGEAIRTKYADLLTKLCKHHSNWCLPDPQQPEKE